LAKLKEKVKNQNEVILEAFNGGKWGGERGREK
jgi:hypothetical protein